MTEEKFDAQRVLVQSFIEGAGVCEVYESRSRDGVKVFYDARLCREFLSQDGSRKRGPYIQQRDLPDILIAIVEAQKWISLRHAEIRRARYAEEDRSLDGVSEGSYGEPEDKE
jgi:hypothetical protein